MHILMFTIGYPPAEMGGTEVYVQGLVEGLNARGIDCSVVYVEPFNEDVGPEFRLLSRATKEASVYALGVNTAKHKLEFIVFDTSLRNALLLEVRKLVSRISPDIIHVHPLQLGFESYLIEELNKAGHNAVLTYHSTTTTCARGDLIYLGRSVCDGLVDQQRCTKCLLHSKSIPLPLAASLSRMPVSWFRNAHTRLDGVPALRKLRSFTSIPLLIEERRRAWSRATLNAKKVIAVCDWVRETIIKNGVQPEKVVSSRHGLRLGTSANGNRRSGKTRFGYLGRISPEKGIDLLVQTLTKLPASCDYEFEFCSSSFKRATRPEELKLVEAIRNLADRDSRVKILDGVGDQELRAVLAGWDAMVVPSRWLESGPQVVYEAFAVHTPVIGTRLGGIAELVQDGQTGFLFTPNSGAELLTLLQKAATDPAPLREMRNKILPVRTTLEVAGDMLDVYRRVVG